MGRECGERERVRVGKRDGESEARERVREEGGSESVAIERGERERD